MRRIHWDRLPRARELPHARGWLEREAMAGLSAATIDAYSRAVEGYLAYCGERRVDPRAATSAHVAAYLRELGGRGLRSAAQRQRLTAIRLFYAFVVEQGGRPDNPAGGAAGIPLLGTAPASDAALPWVPDEDAWLRILVATSAERARTRLMLALAYDAALRRGELCQLRLADFDPAQQALHVSAPGRAGRVVPLTAAVAAQCTAFLRGRGAAGPAGEALFLSESPRNRAQPLTIWTWSKVVQATARRAGVAQLTTHTFRHLRLTDLARAGWDLAAIARFAGYRHPGLARRYLRLAEERPVPATPSLAQRRAEQCAELLFRATA